MRDRVRSALWILLLGVSCWGVAQSVGAMVQAAGEFPATRFVARHTLRTMGDAEADRALGGTPWRHPNPIRNRRKPEPVSGDVAWSASTATVGRLYFHFDEERDPRGRAHFDVGVAIAEGARLDCHSEYGTEPGHERETLLEFRQTPDLRVTQFRCRAVRWGAALGPSTEPRIAVEQRSSREGVATGPATDAMVRRYREQGRRVTFGLGAVFALAAGVELLLHRRRRRVATGLAHAYRGGVPAPTSDAHPWRSHPVVQARGWLWAATLMAAIGWTHARFPLVPSSGTSPDEGIEAIPAMEGW